MAKKTAEQVIQAAHEINRSTRFVIGEQGSYVRVNLNDTWEVRIFPRKSKFVLETGLLSQENEFVSFSPNETKISGKKFDTLQKAIRAAHKHLANRVCKQEKQMRKEAKNAELAAKTLSEPVKTGKKKNAGRTAH